MAATQGLFEWDFRERADDLHEGESVGRAGEVPSIGWRQFAQTANRSRPAEDGAGPEHIVRMTCYITDRTEYLSQRDELAPIWKSIMGANYPAMALVEVKALVEHAAVVEIETTPVVPE